jgi:Heterokaryon incompatibility protein (HET)
MSASLYSEKLGKGHIRLIELRRRPEDNELEAILKTSSFEKAPEYQALSYVWGEKKDRKKRPKLLISCDGYVDDDFRIWQNLHDAFTRIMALTPAGEPCTLWADQICIKQEGEGCKQDKNVQLRQMDDVYTKSRRVLVWLGDPPPDLDPHDVANCMENLMEMAEKMSRLAKEAGPSFDLNAEKMGLPRDDHAVYKVISDIVRKDWYRRLWTLQEAVLAKEMVFHYGAYTLNWDQVVKLVNVYGQMPLLHQQADMRDEKRWRWHHLMLIRQYRDMLKKKRDMMEKKPHIEFAHLLQTGSLKECCDQRDRVYAVLGMAEKSIRDHIMDIKDKKEQENHEITVEEVFLDAFGVVIGCDHPQLHFLSLSYERGAKYALPTWCPDLTQWDANSAEAHMQPPRKRTLAAGKSSIKVIENNRLSIRGVQVDRIITIVHAPAPGYDVTDPAKRRRLLGEFYKQSLKLTQNGLDNPVPKQTAGSFPEAHWRTLINNHRAPPGREEEFSPADTIAGYRYFLAEADFSKLDPRAHQTAEQKRIGALYGSFMLSACNRRRFFKSEKGRVGLAPEGCQVGDVICIFQGAGVPHLLRRNVDDDDEGGSRTFSFIGDCYAHGLMESEVVDRFDAKTLELRDFIVT